MGKAFSRIVYTDLIISTIVDLLNLKNTTLCVYTDLIISTIVDLACEEVGVGAVYTDLIISTIVDTNMGNKTLKRLYGLDNFYYRRFLLRTFACSKVYTDLIISTIVDLACEEVGVGAVYTDLIISTIVDTNMGNKTLKRLYGLDNFYYRRFLLRTFACSKVYTDLIISTIVDFQKHCLQNESL